MHSAALVLAPSGLSVPLPKQIVGDEIAQGQRGHLHDVDFDVDVLELLDGPVDHVALHGEQADLGFEGHAVNDVPRAELLEIPDDFFERKRNLLLGLELDDVGDLLLIDRGQLDEAGQTALAGHADGRRCPP